MAREKVAGRNLPPQGNAKGIKINDDAAGFATKET